MDIFHIVSYSLLIHSEINKKYRGFYYSTTSSAIVRNIDQSLN